MKKDKKEASLLIAFAVSVTVGLGAYGFTYPLDWMAHQGLRTYDECNQLKGTMKDNPENAEFVKNYPDKANMLQKDNCLGGLEYLDHNMTGMRYVLTPTAAVLSFLFLYQLFRPSEPWTQSQGGKEE